MNNERQPPFPLPHNGQCSMYPAADVGISLPHPLFRSCITRRISPSNCVDLHPMIVQYHQRNNSLGPKTFLDPIKVYSKPHHRSNPHTLIESRKFEPSSPVYSNWDQVRPKWEKWAEQKWVCISGVSGGLRCEPSLDDSCNAVHPEHS